MSQQAEVIWRLYTEVSGSDRSAKAGPRAKLEVNVLFTDTRGTLAALRTAGQWARELGARIVVLFPQVVPYSLPLTRPPIPIEFTKRRLRTIVRSQPSDAVETEVQVCLCRDSRECVLQSLKPHSLVVIGAARTWWPTSKRRLARVLRAKGHEVVFAEAR